MTEQVIDIRDRIEKMRTQMTGSSNQANDRKKQTVESKNSPNDSIKIEKMEKVEIVKTANEEKSQILNNKVNLLNKPETAKNEDYKKEGIFIPPTIYDAAKNAGGPMKQKDALKYMIGAYKDGELVKGDAL